jgi:hypothetical protein
MQSVLSSSGDFGSVGSLPVSDELSWYRRLAIMEVTLSLGQTTLVETLLE